MSDDVRHMSQLLPVVEFDMRRIKEKEIGDPDNGKPGYMGSWKKRGGQGAYMMLARKWDRLEVAVRGHGWDIFKAISADTRDEGVLDDIRDLRQYLILVEAEMRCRWDDEEPSRTGTVAP